MGTLQPSDGGRKRRLLSLLIGITVGSGNEPTPAMVNVSDHAVLRGDVEGTTAAHGHFAHIGALPDATAYHRPHEITRLKAPHPLVLLRTGARKAVLVHTAHLP